MKVVYDPRLDNVHIVEISQNRAKIFRRLKFMNQVKRNILFVKGKYLDNRCIVIGEF